MPTDAELKALFVAFDADGSGKINVTELQAALAKGGKNVSPDECVDIILKVDQNADDEIEYDEFKAVFDLAPDALPVGVKQMVDVGSFMIGGLGAIASMAGSSVNLLGSGVQAVSGRFYGSLVGEKEFDIADTNVEKIGSAEDRAVRKAAAATEAAWSGAGASPGLKIWRIEKFAVVPWPEEQFGEFYEGDSYIVLHTYKETNLNPLSNKLIHDLYFWLGTKTSQDEMGTAAYKTVELDDLLDGVPVQHREVMKCESAAFKALFDGKSISYLKGGVSGAFHHVEPGAYVSKLLQVKKVGKTTSIIEVPCKRASLNEGDAFVLDAGTTIYVWSGDSCSPFEKLAANLAAENLESARNGAAMATTLIDESFWEHLGGEGPIASKEQAGEALPTILPVGEGVLYKLSDATGKMTVLEIARGDLKQDMLLAADVYLVDTGPQLIVWVGSKSSDAERAAAFNTASSYLKQQGKPMTTPVSVLKEGQGARHAVFKKIFAN